ncbi:MULTISPECIES: methylenetetrahydrofolate reductase [NAD(P)H] [Herbaspirillum]|jgi:methylenetetrahydrofolate reductase (NADPH)|uniref:methylenetetrahydrofolate reductase [NAD(P)H] n=1 Tax=Herbaspirillum TaxID=963 RepID=UPI000C0A5DE4|nr:MULTISPECIES: methylenetetrahydrofolate reductase [NAD(P)H] [Herbaspirillum]MAF05153.1 methylenetetrahydrofolate reductase [NAD(P)H] [Herbaspirillum sp.]MBN9358757.1 methylenetetrahydrofolate reductase [NAD(P)H] [Herbaspirillum huttiense]MBO14818.1 methylenetetrahydrofolate reductase [NAD(P)H] [Herbaspirillum sp.]MCP3654285.1 methylenetetrahydrofolate reductase [NAD(P)H] [Herbaspirillum sp.]MCP3946183.1 methylenetetrahydrofolate reductase [NAD(P)H] [Herbaspirillum sp.]|tara:strand:- start:374 stop:1216 length:843 start_codon:yes stop_codon:yes gene_type:complete
MSTHNFSIEFFPPKTAEGAEKLRATRARLAALAPKYFSVTFGAGGSTQQGTRDTVLEIIGEGHEAAPHLSCIGSSRASLRAILEDYRSQGIKRLVALRGDLPSGYGAMDQASSEFRHANELVEFVRAETGDWFHIEVAAYPEMHPQARSPQDDVQNFARKVKAGANSAITQYFYNADAYFRFVDEAARLGATVPVIAGIMPITNYTQLMRFSDMCGTEIPRWIRLKLASYGDDTESIRAFGQDVVTQLCQRLLAGGAPGLHFYSLNQAGPTEAIWQQLVK